jgi:hypothetical protein
VSVNTNDCRSCDWRRAVPVNPGRRSHQGGNFAVQFAAIRQSGRPIDGVLQHAGDFVVVFGSGDQQSVGVPNRFAKLHHAGAAMRESSIITPNTSCDGAIRPQVWRCCNQPKGRH